MNNELSHIYQDLVNSLLANIDSIHWDKITLTADILVDNASGISFILYDKENEIYQDISFDTVFNINDLLIKLRDVMLNNTGDRIWNIIFTLFPDGKFEIEYNYNKPDDYDEM